jgi:hypothetical protein
MGWWRFTRLALEALIAPKADAASCDRAMERLARESRLGAAVHRASWKIRAAWLDSRARAAAAALGRELVPRPGTASTYRVAGWMITVAGATALGMHAIKPTPAGPLSSLVPSLVVAAGVLLMLMAAPVARAVADRSRGHKVS